MSRNENFFHGLVPLRKMWKRLANVNFSLSLVFSFILLTVSVEALQITQVTFPEHAMLGQTITMVCEYTVGQSEYVDSIKWYKDNMEFYRIVPNTHIERDRVVTFLRPGIKLDKEKSGVSIVCASGSQTGFRSTLGCL